MPLPWRRARKEASGPARPGRQRGGGRLPEAGWAGAVREGVAAEPPLPERSLWPAADAGSRVRRAPAGLRASVRGHQCTVPRGLRLGAGRRRRRPLPPPPPTPRTKPPHPDSRGAAAAAAAKSSAAYWLPRRLPGNAVPGSGRGAREEEEAGAEREGGARARSKTGSCPRESRPEVESPHVWETPGGTPPSGTAVRPPGVR